MPNKIITNAEEQARKLRLLVSSVTKSALDVIQEAVELIKYKMQQPGAPPTYPIHLDSDRQQRFVMAKLRRENNLPYRRTDAYIHGWVLDRFDEGVSLSHSNPAAAIGGFYMGWQSEIHKGRWPSFTVAVDEVMDQLPTQIEEAITKEATQTLRAD